MITFADEVSSAFASNQYFLDVYQVTVIWDLPQSFGKMLYIFVSVDHLRYNITTKILIPTQTHYFGLSILTIDVVGACCLISLVRKVKVIMTTQ